MTKSSSNLLQTRTWMKPTSITISFVFEVGEMIFEQSFCGNFRTIFSPIFTLYSYSLILFGFCANIYISLYILVVLKNNRSDSISQSTNSLKVYLNHLAGMPQLSHSFLKVIWLACVWEIWKERNNCVFKNAASDHYTLLDKVKLNSFLWLKTSQASFAFCYNDWWQQPFLCISVFM